MDPNRVKMGTLMLIAVVPPRRNAGELIAQSIFDLRVFVVV